jgi:cell division protease FtsH
MRELDRVIGYDSVKDELYRVLDVLKNGEKYREIGVKTPRGVLLDGVPGIGKTLMATCFIRETERKQYIIRKDKPDGDFINHIRKTFDEAAKNEPSVIFLDDMDKFANEDMYHRDAEEYVTVQTCIDDVKSRDVFVIATTNDMSGLPPSLTRNGRFDKVFSLDFPTNEDARKIIDFYLKDKNVDEDIDVEEISRFCRGYSCADLEKILNEAGVYAAYEGKTRIGQRYIIDACLRSIYIATNKEEISDEELRRRAVHEAGHVVIAEILDPGSVDFVSVTAVSNRHRGLGGLVSRRKNSSGQTIKGRETEILISLGGKAASEIVFGEVDMGCNKDMHNVYDLMRTLLDDVTAYDFNSWCHGHETSNNIFDHLDCATGVEISRYYLSAKKILIENRNFLDALVDEIIKEKTISYKSIAVINGNMAG